MNEHELKELFVIIKSGVLGYFSGLSNSDYSYKSGRELVTHADTGINDLITGLIIKRFPDHNILSEEGNCNNTDSDYCWHIDPIDNTVGFIAGESEISVSISLKRSYDYIHSMIINPRTDEIFEAYNSISLLNGQQIKTYSGTLAELTRGVSTCAYVTGTRIQLAKEVMGRAFKARIPLRISGGSALDLCRVAEGKSYAHVCLGAHHWDVEAGIHILKNAGGAVEILELFPDRMALAFIGASSRDVLEELRTTLQI